MDKFKDQKWVAKMAIPLGLIGGFIAITGFSTDTSILQVIGIGLSIASGLKWALHGIAEDQQ